MKKSLSLIQPGIVLRQCSQDEAAVLAEQWLQVFGAKRRGINTKAFLWHIFSSGRYPCVARDEAIAEYETQLATEYVVLSNDRKTAFFTDILPQSSSLSDYYVFPPNLAWTMAFTHEDGWLGPYFARHADFTALNESNLQGVRKLREAELAGLKGWR